MSRFTRRDGLCVALASSALASPLRVFAQPAPAAPAAPASAASSADRPEPVSYGPDGALLAERLRYEGVALAAMTSHDGTTRFSGAGIEAPAPAQDTLFELGSITKTFTALLLADAVTRGEVKLEDAVETVLDGVPLRDSQDQPLRWIDLATHRSGLPRLPDNLSPIDNTDPYALYDWAAMRRYLVARHPDKPRDTAFSYSNLGFGLLGQALAMRAGTDYPTLLRRRVLEPLGLTDQIMLPPAPAERRFVDGHNRNGKPVPHWTFRPAMAGAGALLGSTQGLARYAQAALGQFEHPLKDAFKLCLRRHAERDAPGSGIGLSWLGAPLPGRIAFNHDGATFGFSTSLWLDPSRGNATAVLANAGVGTMDLALHLLEPSIPASDMASTRQPAVTLTPEQLAPLAGTYRLFPAMTLTVRVAGNRLLARATGQGEFELLAKSPRVFFARVTPLQIEFAAGDSPSAPAPSLTLTQQGRVTVAPREAPPAAPDAAASAAR